MGITKASKNVLKTDEIIADAEQKIGSDKIKERLDSAENKLIQLALENSYQQQRRSAASDQLLEAFFNEQQSLENFEHILNKPAEIMDDTSWHNNWKRREDDPIFKNGFLRQRKQAHMLETIDQYNLEGVGQDLKCSMSQWDNTNNCNWLMTYAEPEDIGEIVKISETMKDGKVEIIARYYLPAVIDGNASSWRGIDSDGERLYFTLFGGTSLTASKVYSIKINADGTLGESGYEVPNGGTIDLTNSIENSHTIANSGDDIGYYSDVCIWDNDDIMVLVCNGTTNVNLISLDKSTLASGTANDITGLEVFIGGTQSGTRSIVKTENDLYLRVNDITDNLRTIYKIDIINDISSNVVIKISGKFQTSRDVDPTAFTNEGIGLSKEGDILEITDTASYGKFISRRSLQNALWAENQICGEYYLKESSYQQIKGMAHDSDYIWYFTNTSPWSAGTTRLIRKHKTTGVQEACHVQGTWTYHYDLTVDGDDVYMIGRAGTTYKAHKLSKSSDLISGGSLVSTINLGTDGTDLSSYTDVNKQGITHDGTYLYVMDTANSRISKISMNDGADVTADYLSVNFNGTLVGLSLDTNTDIFYILNQSYKKVHTYKKDTSICLHIYNTIVGGAASIDVDPTTKTAWITDSNTDEQRCYISKILEDPDVLQLHTFLNSNNILLSDEITAITPIAESIFEPEDYTNIENYPGKKYCAVAYSDVNSISLLSLDKFLSGKSSSGLDRYDIRDIVIRHIGFPNGIDTLYTLEDMLCIGIKQKTAGAETVDDTDDVGAYSSIAIDSNFRLHISYYDTTNGNLKYAMWDGSWHIETLDSTNDVGVYSSIAIDSKNTIHISYIDSTNGNLKYTKGFFNNWHTPIIIDNTAFHTSIAIDSQDKIHISYYDTTNTSLKYATNASGSWILTTVDNTATVGLYSSIAIDSQDKIHISYRDTTNTSLKYATNASGSWVLTTVDNTGDVGAYTSIAVDSQDKIHISYYSTANSGDICYATNASGSWVLTTVDSSSNNDGQYSSIAIDSQDKVYISYYRANDTSLRYATNASGSWIDTELDAGDAKYTSIVIDSDDNIHISYYDDLNNRLRHYNFAIYPNISIIFLNTEKKYTYYYDRLCYYDNYNTPNSSITYQSHWESGLDWIYKFHAHTFTKEDPSDYNENNPKTFIAIATDDGCKLLSINWNENNRTLGHLWGNSATGLFNDALKGIFAIWVAPSGILFVGENNTSGELYYGDVPVWQVAKDVFDSIITVGTGSLVNTIMLDIAPNSICWKTTSGEWRHQLLITGRASTPDKNVSKLIDIENVIAENIYVPETAADTTSRSKVDIFEDVIFHIINSDNYAQDRGLKISKKLHFDSDIRDFQNNWTIFNGDTDDSLSLGINIGSNPFFTIGDSDTDQWPTMYYSSEFSVLMIGYLDQEAGVQLFYFPHQNNNTHRSIEFDCDDPTGIHYIQNAILPDEEKATIINRSDNDISYIDGDTATWGNLGSVAAADSAGDYVEPASNVDKAYGEFGDPIQSLKKSDGSNLMEGVDYNNDSRLDITGGDNVDIYDDNDSGAFDALKYFRIINDGENVTKSSGGTLNLNLKIRAKTLGPEGIKYPPPSDECYLDPRSGKFLLPRPIWWAKGEDLSEIEADGTPQLGAGLGGYYNITRTAGAYGSFSVANAKLGKGFRCYAGCPNAGWKYQTNYIYPMGQINRDHSKGAMSLWIFGDKDYDSPTDLGWSETRIRIVGPSYPSNVFEIYILPRNLFTSDLEVQCNVNVNGATVATVNGSAGWHHYYIVWDTAGSLKSGTARLVIYRDGVEIASSNISADLSTSWIQAYQNVQIYDDTCYSIIDNWKIWTDIAKGLDSPTWIYNLENGGSIDTALHPMYGSSNNYEPVLEDASSGVGYYYNVPVPDSIQLAKDGSEEGYLIWENITGAIRTGIFFEKGLDCGRAKLNITDETTSTGLITDQIIDLFESETSYFIYWITLDPTHTYTVRIDHNGDAHPSAVTDYYIKLKEYILIESLDDSEIITSIILQHTDFIDVVRNYFLVPNSTIDLEEIQAFDGDGAEHNFILDGDNHAVEPIEFSNDGGSTWLPHTSTQLSWGSNSPDYDDETVNSSTGYFGVRFVSPPDSGQGNVQIKYVPTYNKYSITTLLLQPTKDNYTDYRKNVRLLDHAIELIS